MISWPSATVWRTPQFLTFENVAPRDISSSSTRKGTTFVNPTSAFLHHHPGEAGHGLSFDQQLAVRGLYMAKRPCGRVDEDHCEGLACRAEKKDSKSLIEVLVVDEIPHRPMATPG